MLKRVLVLLLLTLFTSPALAANPYDDMLVAVPPTANNLLLVDVKGAYASPLGKAEGWLERRKSSGQSALGFVPPYADRLLVASEVNLTSMTKGHQIGIVKLPLAPQMRELANREGGTTDVVAGKLVALSPRDVYFTAWQTSDLAAVYPADRQALSRWLHSVKDAKTPVASPYLLQAANNSGDATMLIALDLAESVDANVLKDGLATSPVLSRRKTLNLGELARFVARVKGLTFTAKITDSIRGTVRVDFDADPAPFKISLRDLLIEAIDDYGMHIPGFDKWEATYTDRSMTLTGPLTSSDLKHLLSLFAFPGAVEEDDPKSNDQPSAAATKRYITAVQAIVDDMKNQKPDNNYDKTATWYEQAAHQIEHLNHNGVDPIALDAAFETAKRLLAVSASLRGVPIDLEAIGRKGYSYSRGPRWGVTYSWWGWRPTYFGPGETVTNYPQIRAEQSKVIADDQKRRLQALSQIDVLLLEARRKLTEKFNSKF